MSTIAFKNVKLPNKEFTEFNLNQGIFKGHFYYGKLVEIEDCLVEIVVFDDKSTAINWEKVLKEHIVETKRGTKIVKEPFGKNQIKEIGLNYIHPLILQSYTWNNDSINLFNGKSVVNADSVDVEDTRMVFSYNIYNIEKKKNHITPLISSGDTLTTLTTPNPDKEILVKTIIQLQEFYMDVLDKRTLLLGLAMVLSSYCYSLFDTIGYIFFNSDKESGKTKYANLLGLMGFHTINSSNPSEAALFRITSLGMGLMIIDDFENLPDERRNALNQILKVGYRKEGKVIRIEKAKDAFVPKIFDCFCPKIITNTTSLEPVTLSRCIPIHLMKTLGIKGKRYPNDKDEIWQIVRNACHCFVMQNWRDIKRIYDEYECEDLNNRDLELVKPFLAIVKFVDSALHEQLLSYTIECFRDRETVDMTGTFDFELYACIRLLAKEDGGWVSTSIITDSLRTSLLNAVDCDDAKAYVKKTGRNLPGVRWVGNRLSRIPSFKKRRVGAGVEYWLSKKLVEDYMKIKGFYVEPEKTLADYTENFDGEEKE